MFTIEEFINIINLGLEHKKNCNNENCAVMLYFLRKTLRKMMLNLSPPEQKQAMILYDENESSFI
jgi:hypothetical protein